MVYRGSLPRLPINVLIGRRESLKLLKGFNFCKERLLQLLQMSQMFGVFLFGVGKGNKKLGLNIRGWRFLHTDRREMPHHITFSSLCRKQFDIALRVRQISMYAGQYLP